jgi:hypothetical protein
MRDYVYEAEFIDILPNGFILLDLDLGFGIRNKRPFKLYLEKLWLYDSAWDAIPSWLSKAEKIMVKSISPDPGQFYADISFQKEGKWYNLLKLLAEEGFVWKGYHASK